VAETALRVLHVPMDRPETAPEPKPEAPPKAPPLLASAEKTEPREEAPPPATPALVGPKVPDFRGRPLVAVLREAASLGLPVETLGRGVAREQSPPPGTVLAPGMRVQVRFGL